MGYSEQVWLEALRSGAGGEDLAPAASRVFRTSGGRLYIPSDADRQRILNLRRDAKSAGLVAFGLAKRNAEQFRAELGRSPTAGELYLAHAFGSETAIALVSAAEKRAGVPLASEFRDIAAEYPELGETAGRPTTVGAAVTQLKRSIERRPSGSEVAVWFRRGPGFALSGDLKGRFEDEPPESTGIDTPFREASTSGWDVRLSQ